MTPPYVTEDEVAELLSPHDARVAVEASLERLARGAIDNPLRVRSPLPDGDFAVMPCVDHELGLAGLKTFVWLPGGTPFLVVLFSIEHAEVAGILEADVLGRLRTSAASAVAAQHLARVGATSLGVIGCGRQAAAHVEALREALPTLERVLAWCPNRGRLETFCAEHGCVPAEDAREAAESEIVVTATTSKDPVLRGEWLTDGATVLAIGANEPEWRELDNVVLERATFVCTDLREQAKLEAGDLIEPVARGVLDWLEVHELHEVVVGEVRGRQDDGDIVLFKSNGLAAWDLAAAAAVLRARDARS
jgi:alanine dehydrogenase